MKSIDASKILSGLCKEFKLKLPKNLETRKIYKEIENFRDFEYTYCIAYEMLIRTDEYNSLLSKYDILMDKNNNTSQTEKTVQLDNLITQMNQLGLNQNSFIGFNCGNGNVFEKIKIYDEIANSPWSVRTLDKFILTPTSRFESALHQLIVFYHEKNELYVIEDVKEKNKKYIKTSIDSTNALLNHPNIYIPCVDQSSKQTIYKSLSDTIYLKELREDFLNILEEKQEKNILKQIKSDSQVTIDFWYKYTLNDVKYGIDQLITYYMNNSKIKRLHNTNQDTITFLEVILKPSDFFVPAIDRSSTPNKHTMMQITQNLPLRFLEDAFLSTLEFSNIKGLYIETEPIFSRPRLVFEEARLINLPINLNLSKEELLFYISQIKDDYDKDKDIVKDPIEYILDLTLEGDYAEMPTNIKHVNQNAQSKKLFPNERKKFKTSLAHAFYIYDLYKFFIPIIEKKRKSLRKDKDVEIQKVKDSRSIFAINHEKIEWIRNSAKEEISKYENNKLITEISKIVKKYVSEEQTVYYLTTMKEFIHGINQEGENDPLKKVIEPKNLENPKPKYKNLIIGNSYIIKSNKDDLIKNLI